MNFLNIQTFLINSSFYLLFSLMLFYWIEAAFFSRSKYHYLGVFGTIIVNLLLFFLLALRWFEEGHFPLTNLYESLIFLSWNLTFIQLFLEKTANNSFVGVVIAPIALFTSAFGNLTLPTEMQKATSLVPALQSNWLMMHVSIMMLSYATLIVGSLFAVLFLILSQFTQPNIFLKFQEKQFNEYKEFSKDGVQQKGSFFSLQSFFSGQDITVQEFGQQSKDQRLNLLGLTGYLPVATQDNRDLVMEKRSNNEILEKVDNLSYRTLGVGFPLLTIGILSGAVWANEAWGSYWSWDPKETWAFITWLIYAIYFHIRITKGWTGQRPAVIASIGFVTVWVCYLGVNLISKGLHSYGWVVS